MCSTQERHGDMHKKFQMENLMGRNHFEDKRREKLKSIKNLHNKNVRVCG
jgi:hypothetical protein